MASFRLAKELLLSVRHRNIIIPVKLEPAVQRRCNYGTRLEILLNIVLFANVADPLVQAVLSGQVFASLRVIWGSLSTILMVSAYVY